MRIPGADEVSVSEASAARLYDKLECALIAMEYALADARACERLTPSGLDCFFRSQAALQSAGGEVRAVLLALQSMGLRSAAARARKWN